MRLYIFQHPTLCTETRLLAEFSSDMAESLHAVSEAECLQTSIAKHFSDLQKYHKDMRYINIFFLPCSSTWYLHKYNKDIRYMNIYFLRCYSTCYLHKYHNDTLQEYIFLRHSSTWYLHKYYKDIRYIYIFFKRYQQ